MIKHPRSKTRRKALVIVLVAVLALTSVQIWNYFNPRNTEAAWWPEGKDWTARKKLTLVNTSSDSLASGTTISVSIDTKALYDLGKIQANCNDIRIVYQPDENTATVLNKYTVPNNNADCSTSEATHVYFKLQTALGNGASTNDYYFYYGNDGASATSSDVDTFDTASNATFICPFRGTNDCLNASGSVSANTETGPQRYPGVKSGLQFDGVNDYGSKTDTSTLSVTGDLTIEAWVKLKETDTEQTLIGKWDETTANDDRSCRLYITSGNKFAFSVSSDGTSGNTTTITGGTTLSKGTWYHVAGTYDASAQTIDLYVNGTSDATQVGSAGSAIDDNASNLYMGAKENTSGTVDTYFLGVLDEVRISTSIRYDSAFTTPAHPHTTDYYTAALYHMDEAGNDPRKSGLTKDSSENGNDLTISGPVYVSGFVGYDGPSEFGSHTGDNNATILTDSTASWADNEWVGYIAHNSTDASHGTITANTANTITVTLTGGTDNDWDNSDLFTLSPDLGKVNSQSDNEHSGVFVEEATTNKIDNPSFENTTYDTSWVEGGGTGVVIATTRTTADTGGGTQDITNSNLEGQTPKAVWIIANSATSDGSASADISGSYGAATGTSNEWSNFFKDKDNVAASSYNSDSAEDTTHVIHISDPTDSADNNPLAIAEFSSFITNGVRINWTTTPADSYFITVVFIAGSNVNAHADSQNLGNTTDNVVDITAPGFEPDMVWAASSYTALTPAIGVSLGIVQYDGVSTVTQRGICARGGGTSPVPTATYVTDQGAICEILGNFSAYDWYGEFGSFDANGFSVTTRTRGANGHDLNYLALDFGSTNSWIGTHSTPTSTGNYSETGPGFTPQFAMQIMDYGETINTVNSDNKGGTFGISVFDANEEYANSWAIEDAATTTNSQSLSDNTAVNITDDDGTGGIVGAFQSFDAGNGWTTNYTTVEASSKLFLSAAVQSIQFLTKSIETNEPYVRFGSRSAKIVASGDTSLVNSVTPGNTNTHTLSFYVYRGTTGSVGGTVDNTVTRAYWEGASESSTTYEDVGGGWWRLSYSAATTNSVNDYGVWIANGETFYVDGFELEEKEYPTTFTDGSLGSGYSWSGTINESSSSRAATDIDYSVGSNISASAGSISFWTKPNWAGNDGVEHTFFDIDTSAGNLKLYKTTGDVLTLTDGTNTATTSISAWNKNDWHHIVATWGSSDMNVYVDTSVGTAAGAFSAPTLGSLFYIGQDSSNGSQANAVISDLRIFDGILTSTEITDAYYSGQIIHEEGVQLDVFDNTKGESPRAIWHFDEGYGTTAHDASPFGYDLTVTGPRWQKGLSQQSLIGNNYLRFDGSNDYAVKANDTDFDFETDSFSLSGWFRHSSTAPASGTDTLIAKYGSTGYKVYMDTNGYICFGIDDDATWTAKDEVCSTSGQGNLADSQWHNFSAVKNTTSSITLYIDGIQVAQDASLAATGSMSSGTSFYVGIDSDGSSNPWEGDIDEVAVYMYPRSVTQISNDLTASQTAFSFGGFVNDRLNDGLVGYWPMEDNVSGNAQTIADKSGNGHDGTTSDGDATLDCTVSGEFGGGCNLDGSDDNIGMGDLSFFDGASQVTVSSWIQPDFVNTDASDHGIWGMSNFLLRFNTNQDDFTIGVNASGGSLNLNTTGLSWTQNTWHHIAAVYDGTNVYIYWDGEIVASGTTSGVLNSSGANEYIGAESPVADSWLGSLDETRAYNRALSPGEIKALYHWAPGPVAYYPMDENTGTSTTNDISGNGYTGTLTSTTESSWVPGKFGSGLYLDGSADFVDVGVGPTKVNSVSFWVNPDTTSEHIIDLNGTAYISASSGTLSATGFTSPTYYINGVITASPTLSTGTWQHVEVTTDTALNASDFDIGRLEGTDYLAGSIDDVRIYNYERTQSQVIQDMNGGHPIGGSPIGSQVAYWGFDEGYGSTATDRVNEYQGTFGGATNPAWTQGKLGNALDFTATTGTDGSRVTYATPSNVALGTTTGDSLTLTAWLKPDSSQTNTVAYFIRNGIGTDENYGLFLRDLSGGYYKLTLQYYDGSSFPGLTSTNTFVPANSWSHLTVVITQGTNVSYYLNGKFIETISWSGSNSVAPTSSINIGGHAGTTGQSYDGLIDEVKVYETTLTQDEILIDMNANAGTSYSVLGNREAATTIDGDPVSNLVLDVNFDENTGDSSTANTIHDKSGNGYTNNTTNSSYTGADWIPGKLGSAMQFDASSTTVRLDSSFSGVNGASAMTISAWIKPNFTSTDSNPYYIFMNGPIQFRFNPAQDDFTYDIQTSSGSTNVTTVGASWSANTWHLLTATYDGSNINIYWDGLYSNTASQTGTINNGANTNIGSNNTPQYYWNGALDEVKVWNSTLTANQIAYLYNRGKAVGWWKFDECSGAVAHDASGNGNNGTITEGGSGTNNGGVGTCSSGNGNEMWDNGTSGKYSASLDFDGTDDYVEISDANNLDVTGAQTISLWFNSDTFSGSLPLVSKSNPTGDQRSYVLYTASSSVIRLRRYISGTTGTGSTVSFTLPNALSTSTWYHLALVMDETNTTADLYIDGILQDSQSMPAIYNSTAPLHIGKTDNDDVVTSSFYNGQIDDVRIYQYELSAAQIKDVMNAGAVRFGN